MWVAFQLPFLRWFSAINMLCKYHGIYFTGQDLILRHCWLHLEALGKIYGIYYSSVASECFFGAGLSYKTRHRMYLDISYLFSVYLLSSVSFHLQIFFFLTFILQSNAALTLWIYGTHSSVFRHFPLILRSWCQYIPEDAIGINSFVSRSFWYFTDGRPCSCWEKCESRFPKLTQNPRQSWEIRSFESICRMPATPHRFSFPSSSPHQRHAPVPKAIGLSSPAPEERCRGTVPGAAAAFLSEPPSLCLPLRAVWAAPGGPGGGRSRAGGAPGGSVSRPSPGPQRSHWPRPRPATPAARAYSGGTGPRCRQL